MRISGNIGNNTFKGTETSNSEPHDSDSNERSNLSDLVDAMKQVKTDTPEAELNSHSISDGNGGRIELNEEEKRRRKHSTNDLRYKQF